VTGSNDTTSRYPVNPFANLTPREAVALIRRYEGVAVDLRRAPGGIRDGRTIGDVLLTLDDLRDAAVAGEYRIGGAR
jgi:hypothetical protein